MRVGISIRHSVDDESYIIAMIVGAASRRFDAEARRDSGDDDLGHALPLQIFMQVGAYKCSGPSLCDDVIIRLPHQFGNELGPIVRQREGFFGAGIGATGNSSCNVHKYDRQATFAERTRKLRGPVDDRSRLRAPRKPRRTRPNRFSQRRR